MTRKLIFSILIVFLLSVAAFAADYEWVASSPLSAVTAQTTSGTLTTVAASSTALVNLFSGLANDETHTHVLIRVKNGTNVYFNGTVATPSLGLAFTSSDGLWKLPLTPEVRAFTLSGDAGTETVVYMPITEE